MAEKPGNQPRPRGESPAPRGNRAPERRQESRRERGNGKNGEPRRKDGKAEARKPGPPRQEKIRSEKEPPDRTGGRKRERKHPGAKPGPPAPPLWRRVLRAVTFGLLDPAGKKGHQDTRRKPSSKSPRQQPAPPADVEAVDTDRLYVGNLSYHATESDLMDVFGGIGKVQNVDIVYSGRTYRSKGCGFVQMMSVMDARRAVLELHGKSFMGRLLHLGPARTRGEDEREADDAGGLEEESQP